MAKGLETKHQRNKSRGADTDEEANMAQEQRMAPMSGLNDMRAVVANASTGIWQQIEE